MNGAKAAITSEDALVEATHSQPEAIAHQATSMVEATQAEAIGHQSPVVEATKSQAISHQTRVVEAANAKAEAVADEAAVMEAAQCHTQAVRCEAGVMGADMVADQVANSGWIFIVMMPIHT